MTTTVGDLIKALEVHASTHPDGIQAEVDLDMAGVEYKKISDVWSDKNGIHLMCVQK